jgi:hypothetical protein
MRRTSMGETHSLVGLALIEDMQHATHWKYVGCCVSIAVAVLFSWLIRLQ